jgi:hypothetical protein
MSDEKSLLELIGQVERLPNPDDTGNLETLYENSDDAGRQVIDEARRLARQILVPHGRIDRRAMTRLQSTGLQVAEAGVPGDPEQQGVAVSQRGGSFTLFITI